MNEETLSWVVFIGLLVLLACIATLNEKLNRTRKQLDLVLSNFDGLREYLYEIDPQFDDERASDKELQDESNVFAAYDDLTLLQRKEHEGRRTLNTSFFRRDEA